MCSMKHISVECYSRCQPDICICIYVYAGVIVIWSSSSHPSSSSPPPPPSLGTELPLMFESYGLLNNIFPFLSILDTGYQIFNLHLANVLFDIFLCTRFHLHPLNRPVPFLCSESWAWKVSHGWVAGPSHNPQPGGQGDLFSRFSSSSLYRSLCQPQGGILVLVCPGYFISPVPSISLDMEGIHHLGRHPMWDQ